MRCKDCGHKISVNKVCEKPIQAATDMLKHMAAHNASRAFATVAILAVEPLPVIHLIPWIASIPQSPN
jgi:hypothetical protein